jgi:hypothetical protein
VRARIAPFVMGCALAAATAPLGSAGCGGFVQRRLFTHSPPTLAPTAADCERCHQEVVREWRHSRHAQAWRDLRFQAASAGGEAEECTGCHAGAPVMGGAAPALRALHREEGVTCVTCHLSPDPGAAPLTMRGPVSRTSPVEAHPVIEEDPLYRSSELCGSCHQGVYAEWLAADASAEEASPTCQQCHMPEVRRKVESVHDEHIYSALFVALGEEATLRRHRFDVPDAEERLALAARVVDASTGPGLEVTLRNGLPHALPTGDFGRRAVRLLVTWPGGEAETRRSRRRGQAIPAGGEWTAHFTLPAVARPEQVEVRLERWNPGSATWSDVASARPEAR